MLTSATMAARTVGPRFSIFRNRACECPFHAFLNDLCITRAGSGAIRHLNPVSLRPMQVRSALSQLSEATWCPRRSSPGRRLLPSYAERG